MILMMLKEKKEVKTNVVSLSRKKTIDLWQFISNPIPTLTGKVAEKKLKKIARENEKNEGPLIFRVK